MFTLDTYPQWGTNFVRVSNERTGQFMTIVPAFGALLQSLILQDTELIEGYPDEAHLQSLHYGRSIFLCPFPNRLDKGQYQFDGQTYQFPLNMAPNEQNAIHGFCQDKAFELSESILTDTMASLSFTYQYEGDNPAYPFPFTVNIKHHLDAEGYTCTTTIKNLAVKAIPMGMGWHPYFKLADSLEGCSFQLPQNQGIEVAGQLIPTGVLLPSAFEQLQAIDPSFNIDNGFMLSGSGKAWCVLQSARQTLKYWQETGEGKFNFLQVFIPPWRGGIAFEPMSCAANAFNNGLGLTPLQTGATMQASWGIQLDTNA